MTTFECDSSMKFDDENLPSGVCDDITNTYSACLLSNVANGWAVGGDHVRIFIKQSFKNNIFVYKDG